MNIKQRRSSDLGGNESLGAHDGAFRMGSQELTILTIIMIIIPARARQQKFLYDVCCAILEYMAIEVQTNQNGQSGISGH